MPRPKPPEELIAVTYRLTRTQIRKVQEMGGVEWLRLLISSTKRTKHPRTSLEYKRLIGVRNASISADTRSTKEVAASYKLSTKQINKIKRQYSAP